MSENVYGTKCAKNTVSLSYSNVYENASVLRKRNLYSPFKSR